jgi:nucleoside 2-deoxyribosyltransferase
VTHQKPLIYLAIKYHPDHSNRSLIEQISDTCSCVGFETVCVDRDIELYGGKSYSASELMQLSFDKIKKADYILIDLSEKGVGIGIEAGYAYALGIPIITILPVTAHLSTTLAGISNFVYHYQTPDEVSGLLKSILYSEND